MPTSPPSDGIIAPTVYAPALEHRKITNPAISSGEPILFLGFLDSINE
jgi:hypothetical protein